MPTCRVPTSDYVEIGGRCDRVAIFHIFGVYLLRGHTLFTLFFLVASIVVFLLTSVYHWRVRAQHNFLSTGLREQSPHRRRETLFNTLLLSIGAFFVSVSGQSYIEIAVFWADDRAGIAALATFYQWTRIAAFVDPVLNPILVAVRTPTIRRRVMSVSICSAAPAYCTKTKQTVRLTSAPLLPVRGLSDADGRLLPLLDVRQRPVEAQRAGAEQEALLADHRLTGRARERRHVR